MMALFRRPFTPILRSSFSIPLSVFLLNCHFWRLPAVFGETTKLWSYDEYPDIKDTRWGGCGAHTPKLGYVCDPDHIITEDEAIRLNNKLYDISTKTKCKCRRKSQCMSQTGPYNQKITVGFVVVIAFAQDIAWTHSVDRPHDVMAAKFSKGLRDQWVLGDCGNSVLIFVWERQLLIHIVSDEKSREYVTAAESLKMTKDIQSKLTSRDDLVDALMRLLLALEREFDGEPKTPVDIGKLALILASTVALISVSIVIGCVCAFRFETCRPKNVNDETHAERIKDRIKEDRFVDTEVIFDSGSIPKCRVEFWGNDAKV